MAVKKIQLEPEQLNRLAQKLKSTATEIQGHSIELNSAYKNIDWSFTASACVDRRFTQAEIMRKQVNEKLIQMSQYVQTSAILLSDADRQICSTQIMPIPTLPWWQNFSQIIGGVVALGGIAIGITSSLPWIRRNIIGGNIVISPPKNPSPITEPSKTPPIIIPTKPEVGLNPIGVWPTPKTGIGKSDFPVHSGYDILGDKGDPINSILNGKVVYAGTSAKTSAPCKGKEDCHSCKRPYIFSSDPTKSSDHSTDPNLRNIGCNFGNVVKIDTIEPINGKYYRLIYAHLDEISPEVIAGKPLVAGTQIGGMGSTGASNANHLHFQVKELDEHGNEKDVDIDEEDFLKLIGAI